MEILFGVAFLIFGLIFSIVGFRKKKVCTEIANATVVDSETTIDRERRRDSDGGYETHTTVNFIPIYEYYVDGNKYTVKGSSKRTAIVTGQTVQIHYNPNNPSEFYEGTFLLPIVLGVAMAVAGIIITIMTLQ